MFQELDLFIEHRMMDKVKKPINTNHSFMLFKYLYESIRILHSQFKNLETVTE
jgi:hypothetical protein